MNLTWRDAITTILVVTAVIIAVAAVREWNVPLIGNARWAALLLIVIGILMCIAGSSVAQDFSNPYVALMGVLAGGVVLLAIIALIVGAAVYVGLAAALMVVMWLVSAIRHMVG